MICHGVSMRQGCAKEGIHLSVAKLRQEPQELVRAPRVADVHVEPHESRELAITLAETKKILAIDTCQWHGPRLLQIPTFNDRDLLHGNWPRSSLVPHVAEPPQAS